MTPPEAVIARVFGVSQDRINDQTSNETLPEWDSLGHITLVIELEAEYGVSLSPEETLSLTNVAAIKRLLEERGMSW